LYIASWGKAQPTSLTEMKLNKKKMALPPRQWKISPVTRVKSSAKTYSQMKAKRDAARHEQ
jgi:hypothetical protein